MKNPDDLTGKLMELIDNATYAGQLMEEIDHDAAWYHEDSARAFEIRCLHMQTAALGAIAILLLRRDEEMLEAWQRY